MYLNDFDLKKNFFEEWGFTSVESIISKDELEKYVLIYNDLLSGKINAGNLRSDLGENLGTSKNVENITQIMWPSDLAPQVHDMPYHQNALQLVKQLLGTDMEMDFDMLIDKAPHTNTITPWHQDAAYWVNLPDKRAASCWMAIDEATIDNGCMWYVPGSNHKPLRTHWYAGKQGGALMCEGSEDEATPVPLLPGSCALHSGNTLHYSRGNTTSGHRRAWIINFRPSAMIKLERAQGFDHGRTTGGADRKIRNIETV